ncbi:MAG: NAD-dependent epimerase/dehydratase family protein, partial [Methanoregulaceae archaeon]|nr:NAD-dependent epimerase/dehydratase family protein [Methanoregulaceae archaeon]
MTSGQVSNLELLNDKKILITGGTGFMGTWLAEVVSFLNDTCDFHIQLYLLSTRANMFGERVPHLASRPDITLINRDIRNLNDVTREATYIVHAAASPDSRVHASDPLRTIEVIVNGTHSVLEYATNLPTVEQILNISS